MEGYSRKDDGCPQLLDLIPKDGEWIRTREDETSHGVSEEKKLELTLGLPTGEWTTTSPYLELKSPSPWKNTHKLHSIYCDDHQSGQGQVAIKKESLQPCSNTAAEKKPFSALHSSDSAQKSRTASVVGWPPIRSFRKNIGNGSSSKLASDSPNSEEKCSRSPFVKINMDGIPIGRKIDLKAYNSYEKLSLAVDELFKGLLAGEGNGGLLDGGGEYTLVYEDNDGDRMLVGDVPWKMFVSTVKRLRVLRSADLPALSRGIKQGKPVP